MEDGHIFGLARIGMPAEQVVVKLAELARGIVMADVVKVHLRPGGVDRPEDQANDPADPDSLVGAPWSSHHTETQARTIGRDPQVSLSSDLDDGQARLDSQSRQLAEISRILRVPRPFRMTDLVQK